MFRWLFILLVLAGIGYTLYIGPLNAALQVVNLPVKLTTQQVKTDVTYGPENRHKLDMYYPTIGTRGSLPVIVFFHGGNWQEGDKSQYRFVAETLAAEGYAVAIPNYAKFPPHKFPTFVQDGARAVSYIHKNANNLGVNPERIYLAGHSAGAQIGALLAADRRYLRQVGCTRACVRAFVGIAGPYAFTPDDYDLQAIFGPAERYPMMRVPTFVDGQQAPMLLLYGEDDKSVEPSNHEQLAAAIKKRGGTVKVITYPRIGHYTILAEFIHLLRDQSDVVPDMIDFYKKADDTIARSEAGTQ